MRTLNVPTALKIVHRASPNFTERRDGGRPRFVILHYTAMTTGEAAIRRLCDPQVEASAHYLVGIEGTTTAMVQEDMRAWHAGLSHWAGINDINSWSIGIEIANPGHLLDYAPFPDAQMTALEYLLSGLLERWQINPQDVISHACIAPGRKFDPGEKLDWRRLARAGLAVWVDPPLERSATPADLTALCRAAARLGYQVPDEPGWGPPMRALWRSLSMRWLGPSPLFGHPPCEAGLAHIEKLADRWPVQRGFGDV